MKKHGSSVIHGAKENNCDLNHNRRKLAREAQKSFAHAGKHDDGHGKAAELRIPSGRMSGPQRCLLRRRDLRKAGRTRRHGFAYLPGMRRRGQRAGARLRRWRLAGTACGNAALRFRRETAFGSGLAAGCSAVLSVRGRRSMTGTVTPGRRRHRSSAVRGSRALLRCRTLSRACGKAHA